jgi:hypothetical protein
VLLVMGKDFWKWNCIVIVLRKSLTLNSFNGSICDLIPSLKMLFLLKSPLESECRHLRQ